MNNRTRKFHKINWRKVKDRLKTIGMALLVFSPIWVTGILIWFYNSDNGNFRIVKKYDGRNINPTYNIQAQNTLGVWLDCDYTKTINLSEAKNELKAKQLKYKNSGVEVVQ